MENKLILPIEEAARELRVPVSALLTMGASGELVISTGRKAQSIFLPRIFVRLVQRRGKEGLVVFFVFNLVVHTISLAIYGYAIYVIFTSLKTAARAMGYPNWLDLIGWVALPALGVGIVLTAIQAIRSLMAAFSGGENLNVHVWRDSLEKSKQKDGVVLATPDPSRAHVSNLLAVLNQAAQKFWANASRDDRSTHPINSDVAKWLAERGYSPTKADQAASIIRPEWAPSGRKPDE